MRDHVRDALAYAERCYPGRVMPKDDRTLEDVLADWREALREYDGATIAFGIRDAINGVSRLSDPQFPPTLPEIRRAVAGVARAQAAGRAKPALVNGHVSAPEHAAFCFAMIKLQLARFEGVPEQDRWCYADLASEWLDHRRTFALDEAVSYLETRGVSAAALRAPPPLGFTPLSPTLPPR